MCEVPRAFMKREQDAVSDKESTIRKCKNVRDRIYSRDLLPAAIFRKEVLEQVSSESVVLDIGCGRRASFLRSLAPCVKTAYGVDLEIAETVHEGNMTLMHGDAVSVLLPDHSVDIITMIHVSEHLCDPDRVFLECGRVLRPGGSLVLIAPSKFYLPILIGRAIPHGVRQWANSVMTGSRSEDTFPAYYRANSPRALRRLAAVAGFDVAAIRYVSNHPQYFMFSTVLYRCAVAFERHVLQRNAFRRFRPQILCRLVKPRTSN